METTSRHATYAQVGPFRPLVRATAATRPVTWMAVRTQQPQAVGMHPGFAIYRTRAINRRIPVVRLDPA